MTHEPEPEIAPSTRRPRRVGGRLLLLLVAAALGIPAGFLFAHAVRMPVVKKLADYSPAIITRVYDRNGHAFAEYSIQRRIVVAKKDMSPLLVNAIIATEDSEFYRHGGIDPKGILRAALKNVIEQKRAQGASTLTQQLAKQVFLTPDKTFRRKINEAFLAVQIEKDFTKDQIFELYANQVYLGHGAYGVEAGSRLFFGKNAKDLTLPEAAVIAAVIQRPGHYSPINHPERTKGRRDYVLSRMLSEGFIDRQQYQRAVEAPIVLGTFKEESPNVGAYFAEMVRQYIEQNEQLGAEQLYSSGLKVHTTLDLKIQEITERALQRGLRRFDKRRGFRRPTRNLVEEGLDPEAYADPAWTDDPIVADKLYPAVVLGVTDESLTVRMNEQRIELPPDAWKWTRRKSLTSVVQRGDLVQIIQQEDPKTKERTWMFDQLPNVQGAVVVLDVKSGEIRALSGGYEFSQSKFNRAVQSRRQTGSIFKPFVYGAAFETGLTPADTLFDAPISIQLDTQVYSPKNYEGKYTGIVTIQRALELSINIPAVKTFMMVGADRVIDFTRRLGVTSDLPPYPSLALGAAGVSPLEMAAAFNVFANNGVYTKPRYIQKIADQTDRTLVEIVPELSEATSPQVAYETAYMMKGVIDRGTGYAANKLAEPLAGKTGTTNGYTDAWFVGFSPEYTIGVWTGYDDPAKSLGGGATGADVPLPIWIDIFHQLEEEGFRSAKPDFEAPPGVVIVPMDLKTGRRGTGPCGRVVKQAFIAGQEPNKDCSGESIGVAQLPFYLQRPMYQAKEGEPIEPIEDASAQSGESAESPSPTVDAPATVTETTSTDTAG